MKKNLSVLIMLTTTHTVFCADWSHDPQLCKAPEHNERLSTRSLAPIPEDPKETPLCPRFIPSQSNSYAVHNKSWATDEMVMRFTAHHQAMKKQHDEKAQKSKIDPLLVRCLAIKKQKELKRLSKQKANA